jgi:uncharacterized protein DUF4386
MTTISKNARVAGLLYIVASVIGFVRLGYVPKMLFVHANPAATANNIAAHELLFRLGMLCYVFGATVWLFVPLALYRLLSSVNRTLAVLMVILGSLMQVPLFFANSVTDAGALLLARGGDFVSVFDKPQRDALMTLFLNLHHQVDVANELWWGIWLLPFGVLVYRSGFLPRLLGVLLILACCGWVALSITAFMAPSYEATAFTMAQPFVQAEIVTMLWLAILGARERFPHRPLSAESPGLP